MKSIFGIVISTIISLSTLSSYGADRKVAQDKKYSYYGVEFDENKVTIRNYYNPPNPPDVVAEGLNCTKENSGSLFCWEQGKTNDYWSVTMFDGNATLRKHFSPPKPPKKIATLTCKNSSFCIQKFE